MSKCTCFITVFQLKLTFPSLEFSCTENVVLERFAFATFLILRQVENFSLFCKVTYLQMSLNTKICIRGAK